MTVARTVKLSAAVRVAGSAGSMETSASGSPRIATEFTRCPGVLSNTSVSGTPATRGVEESSVCAILGSAPSIGTLVMNPSA